MGAEFDLVEDDGAVIFSIPRVRSRLQQGGYAVQTFRETLVWGRERLHALFHEDAPAEALVHARTHLVDEILRSAWRKFLPEHSQDLALVAVGGYGRGELLPHSDIDILLLYADEALEAHRPALEALTAFCWDIGLEIGQSVRTVAECAQEAAKDITVITNLLEARPLIGDEGLFEQMQAALQPEQLWSVSEFFAAKKQEQQNRHAKYDDTGYKLEPNVKESPGGLRDIHTIGWVAKRHFGAQTLAELRDHGFLTKQECDELFAGQELLWRVRFALHMISGRHEDRLLFDYQVKVAQLFGYVDTNSNKAVEQFMQLYYRTIKSLSCLNDMLLQLFDEAILHRDTDTPQVLNARFQICNGYIEAQDNEVFRKNPWALLELFLLMQKHPQIEGVRAQTLRMVLRDRRLLNDEVRGSVKARALFIEMFRTGNGLTRALRRMNRYGVLGTYLPDFGRIVGLMQYDLFHTLTVDEHVLYVLRNARRFALPRLSSELPFCSEVMAALPKPELLYLACLWHDMAKGRGGDHSELGAHDAEQFCLEHGLSHTDAALVAWLVRNHLLMSLTAQKQDLSDPGVIAGFANRIGTRNRLDYLFLLTCADIRGTNPALWNSWRESLLKDLYQQSARLLQGHVNQASLTRERASETRLQALDLVHAKDVDATLAESVWARLDDEYFLRYSPQEIAWQLPALARTDAHEHPVIMVDDIAGHGVTVFIHTRDRDHLFALSTGVLAQLGLSILDARLHTTRDGMALNTYIITESDGSAISSATRCSEIHDALLRVLDNPEVSSVDVNRRVSQRLKHFSTPTQIYVSQDTARQRTVLELVASDQPGLLSMIGRVFQKRGVRVDSAKIATIGERAEDVFYITDREQRPITDDAQLDELREVILRTLDRRDS